MKKSLLLYICAAALTVILTACGGANTDESTAPNSERIKESTEITEETMAAPTEKVTEATTEDFTEDLTEESASEIEEYTDISSLTSPVIEPDKKSYVTVSSNGNEKVTTSLNFDGFGSFTISNLNISGIHNTAECTECGYREINGSPAYYICKNTNNQGGFTLTLDTPIPANAISGMTVTFITGYDVKNGSQIRIIPFNGNRNDSFINECPSLSGAVGDFMTCDAGLEAKDIAKLTDADGMISSFKLYFRNKDNTDIYIKSIEFVISYDELCKVTAINENCFYRGGAIDFVSSEIASRLSTLGISAEITVKATGYTQNTTAKSGKLTYNAMLSLPDRSEVVVKNISATISPIRNTWLERADSPYGALTDSKEQWKTRFDRGGLIYLENNSFDGIENLKTVEYAVISADDDVTGNNVRWFAPQILNIDGNTFSLYANAFLDYGGFMTGKDYCFVVRAITNSDNYVLHLDIPFTYESLDYELEERLSNLSWTFQGLIYTFDDSENLADKLKEKVTSEIAESGVIVTIEERTMGISQATFDIKLRYVGDIPTDRFPQRPSDKLYDYNGEHLTIGSVARFNLTDSSIALTAPEDGARDVVIASKATVDHMNADLSYLTSAAYPFTKTEACLPEAITFEWIRGEAEDYTLIISESIDMSNPITYTAKRSEDSFYMRIKVNNLKASTTYYWQVKAGDQISNMACFTTADYPRFIFTEKISNFRDIGGYVTLDGYRVKQGIAYRSAQLEAASENDKQTIKMLLGIKTDLDLRGQSTVSPLGSDIRVIPISIQWYTGVFENENHGSFRNAISQFAIRDNYPMLYHCAIGRDRTGTVTTTILALLGVEEEMLIREYLLSFNSVSGNSDGVPGSTMVNNIKSFINGLKAYGDSDATLAEHTEAFLLEIGITAEEIQAIRDILLEK
ncbi:MAG: tyrosine-protein phosphatase [Clostridia bacterium]|nr:tyrosine-protein phosphatase [Clostridia bacterium]